MVDLRTEFLRFDFIQDIIVAEFPERAVLSGSFIAISLGGLSVSHARGGTIIIPLYVVWRLSGKMTIPPYNFSRHQRTLRRPRIIGR
jgi:hypothetical protein